MIAIVMVTSILGYCVMAGVTHRLVWPDPQRFDLDIAGSAIWPIVLPWWCGDRLVNAIAAALVRRTAATRLPEARATRRTG